MSSLKRFCFSKFLLPEERFVFVGHIKLILKLCVCVLRRLLVLRKEGEKMRLTGCAKLRKPNAMIFSF